MILRRIKAIVEEGSYTLDDGLLFWRERIIKSIHLIAITFGLPIYFFSIYQGVDAGYYNLIINHSVI